MARVMGILNVTPDSFSDGGLYLDADLAVAHGLAMVEAGAAIIDVGGESTRPGAAPVDPDEEMRRVLPVIAALVREGVCVSIDTRQETVARAGIGAGASIVNDVSASLGHVAAECGIGYIAMHMQGEPKHMQDTPHYDDVVSEVRDFLVSAAEVARAGGAGPVWIDPGIGFGKTLGHNLDLLAQLDVLVDTGYPVAIGTSRKGFLGVLTGGAPVEDRLEASLATAVLAALAGVDLVRAHDVGPTVQALRVVDGVVAA